MLSQFGSEGDESSENIIRLNPPKFRFSIRNDNEAPPCLVSLVARETNPVRI